MQLRLSYYPIARHSQSFIFNEWLPRYLVLFVKGLHHNYCNFCHQYLTRIPECFHFGVKKKKKKKKRERQLSCTFLSSMPCNKSLLISSPLIKSLRPIMMVNQYNYKSLYFAYNNLYLQSTFTKVFFWFIHQHTEQFSVYTEGYIGVLLCLKCCDFFQ